MVERPLYTLYKNLKAQNYDVPDDYNKFESALTRDGKGGADNRHAIYENLKAQNFDVPSTYERFYSALFEPRSKTSSRAKGGSVPMSAADRARFSAGAAAISASAQQTMNNAGKYNRLKQRKQKQQKDFGRVNLGTHQTPYGGDANNVVKDDFAYNPETGKAGVYVTSDNENAYTQNDAEQKQAILDQQNNAYQQAVDTGEIPSALDVRDKNGNYDLQENIGKNGTYLTEEGAQKQFDKKLADAYARKKEIEALIAEDNRQHGNPLLSYGASIGASNGRTAEQSDYRNKLATSLSLVTEQIGALEAVKQYPTSSWGEDALKAIDNTAFTAKTWDFGLTDFATMGQMERIKTKMDNNIPLSGSDKMLLKSKLGADAAAALEDEKMGNIYRWTKIAGQSLPFMLDFFMTGGYGGITKGISRGALKFAAKRGMGKVSAAILKNTGIVAGDVIGSYAMAGTEQALKTGADIMQRHLGNLYQDEKGDYKFGTFDENGNLLHEGGESMGTALYKGLTSAMVENYTEKLFGHNYGIKKGAIAAMEKHGMNGAAQFFKNIGKSGWYTNSKKWMEKFGINGFGEEVMEEEIGIPLHALLDGDNKFSDLGDAKQQLDIIGGMAISVGSMYAMGAGSRPVKGVYNRAQYYRFRNKVNVADSDAQNLLGDNWADIKDKIDNATNEQMGSVLAGILRQRDTMTKEQINAAVNYGVNLMKMRGYNIAKTAEMNAREITNEPTTPEEQHQTDIDNAYSEGHDADDADKHDIQIQQEDQMKTLAAALGISEQQLSAMSDEELESLTGRDDKLDQAIYDYQLSSARYQGVVDDAQDKVDLAAHQAEQRVDMYTDQSRGSVRNATIKASGGLEDYGVYIISGNIATHDDGSIDVSNSDDMILYYDPTTNSVEHADALMFAELGEELPADDVKAQAVADAKENAIKEVAGIIDGTVEVGSQFNVTDADGSEHTYEVLADYGDGTAAISIDGNVVENPYSLADLQQMKDLEDQKRLEAAKAEREQMEKERAEQQTQEVEETQPSFDFNQILNDDGNVVLVDVLDKDGNTKYPDSRLFLIRDAGAKAKVVEFKSDGTIVPHAVNKEDVATISSMSLDEYKQAMPETSMIEDNSGENRGEIEVETPTIEGETAAPTEETAAPESADTPATEQAPAAPAIALEDGTIVPMLEDGNPDFSKLTAAQTAELYDSQFGEDADSIVSGYVADAKKALDKASNMTVKGKTFVEQKAAKDAKEKAIAEAQAAYDSAIAIRDAYNERQLAKVEDTAEGRKNLIDKARRKFARLKSAVKDDAEAVAQLYKETVGTLLHRLYDGTGIDVTDTIPLTAEEYVASNLGAHSLNYEGTETSKGVKQETGLSREDFAKTQLLAADGKGTTIDNLVHSLWENRPSNLESLGTQDIRNALLSVITSGFKASEARNYIENLRIAQAENMLEEQKKAADNAAFADEQKAESEQQTETAPEPEEKTGEDNSDEITDEENEQTNENINAPEVPEDATDENPLGAQRDQTDLPFSARDNGTQQTTSERAADVEKNKVDDMKVVDNIVGQKNRKAFERLAKMMGANIQWQYSDKLGNGWIQETTDADGNVHRTIFITLDSSITEGAQFIFGHEMTHQIKNLNPAAYNELTQLVLDTYGADAFDKAVDETMKRYSDAGLSGRARDYYAEEVMADAVGEMIRDLNLAHTLAMKMSHPLLAAIHEILQKIKLAFYGTEYSDVTKNIIRSIEQAYVKTAKGEVTNSETGEDVSFSLRQKPEPKKKGIGYKVFVLKDGKLYPPMVANPNGAETPVGVWLDADAAPIAGESKTGRPQVKQGGKGTQGGSGKLAYRPGWHLGVVPYAIQFNRKDAEGNKTLFPKNFVFAEVEYAADVDYQEEARQEGINPSGKYQHSLAGLKHLPTDGYYMYRTNPNPETDPWVITGAMKVNRILTRAEQADLVSKAGREPQQIQEGDIVTDDVVDSINQEIANAPKFSIKTYHGSQASFDKFDHSFMGSGEGAQAYGWGTYVSEVEGIAKAYAKANAKKNAPSRLMYQGKPMTYKTPTIIYQVALDMDKFNISAKEAISKMIDANEKKLASVGDTPFAKMRAKQVQDELKVLKDLNPSDFKINEDYDTVAQDLVDTKSGLDLLEDELKDAKSYVDLYQSRLDEAKEELSKAKESGTGLGVDMYESDIEYYSKQVERYKQSIKTKESDIKDVKNKVDALQKKLDSMEKPRNLYSVDIPDDTGRNYIGWDEPLGAAKIMRLPKVFKANGWEYKKVGMYDTYKIDGNEHEVWLEPSLTTGKELYRDLTNALGSDKAASEFLSKAGFVGVKVIAQRNTGGNKEGKMNYVIFDENNAQITSHTKFSLKDPFKMSDNEKKERGDRLIKAPVIDVASGVIQKTADLSARKAAEMWWSENVEQPLVFNTEVGDVVIDEKSIKDSLAHRYNQAKLDSITSLPAGFGNSVYIGTISDFVRTRDNVQNHYFAYPINYDGQRNYVFCRAMQDTNKNRLYVHEVFVADKINEGNTLQTAASKPHGGIALYKEILANVLSAAKIDNSSETAKKNGEKVEVEEPKTFEEFLNHPSLKFSIKNEEQRKAAEDAYEYAAKLRPNKYAQYALVDMSNPSNSPEYYEKKVLADRWRRFYNKAVHNELDDVYKDAWGNYKLFDLDRPFADQVNEVKGDVPNEFNAPDVTANKNADNESGAEYHEYKQGGLSSVTYEDRYKAFKQREANREKVAGLKKELKETEDSYNLKGKERAEYQKQLMKEYMDKHKMTEEYEIPDDVWEDLRSKSFEKYQDELDSLFNKYKDLDRQIKAVAEPRFSLKDEKTLAGVHNITEEKLRKALKLGGFANPSLAVIDTNKSGHDNFGEISFIAPSALLDKRTGKTAGTWITDAYTQRYPSVEREMSEKGSQKFRDWVDSLEYPSEAKAEIKRQAEDALSNNNAPAWELMYLKEKGIDIKEYDSRIDYRWKEIIRDYPTAEDILNSMQTDPELNEKVTSLAKHAIIHPTWEKVSLEVRRKMYEETGVKASPINPQVRKQTKEIFERDYAPSLLNKDGSPRKKDVKKVVEDIVKEHNDTKKYDFYLSKVKASNYVNKNGLYDDYIRWQENKLDEFGTKNRIFRGYTKDGSRKYVPETLENVSKAMREEADGQTNGSEYTSFGSFIAKLASRVDSTDEMRANKDKLSSNKDKEEFYEKWESVYYDLAKSLYNDVFYGEQRLHDIVLQSDPKKYAKKEYGITLTPTFMKKLDALKNAVQTELKSAYFETKYNRPLRLNEFAAAVVPNNLGDDVRKGIENAGLPMYDYDPNKEGDRSRAFNEAINSSDNIRFSLAGERGAAAADKAEERTFRMDNLSVARKMEEEKKDAKAIKMATGWERGADGKWRYEMPDAKIKDTMDVGGGHIVKRYEDDMLWNGGKLSKVIDVPELFKAYPQLKDVRIETDAIMNDMPSNGEYNSKTNTITIHADELKYMNSILNHEIQHAIQDIEGFAKGGSPRLVRGEVKKKLNEVTKQIRQLRAEGKEDEAKALVEKNRGLYNAYQKNDDYNSYVSLAGEVEARNVSARLNMTPEERRKTLAESTEDVARKDQIFLGVGDVSFSLRDMADGKESGAADMAEDLKSLNTPDEVDDAIKTAIEDMPSGWKMANKKMIHVAQALGENRKAEIAGEEPKFSLKDGSLIKAGTYFSGGGLVEEGDYNYVIFDENNANIVGNTKFSLRYDQFEHDLNQWKKDNNLPKDAQRPTIPQRNAGESAAAFLRRVDEYRKQMALWKTAPTYEQHLLSDDTALGEFNRELQRGSVLKRIAFQDSMLAIRKAQEAIIKEVGVDRLNMAEDAYTAENRSHGKGKNEFEEYNNEFLQPLRKAYHQMKKILGDSYDNVRIYMMAKHGLERDAQMAFKKSLEADYEDVAQRSAAYRAYKGDMNRITNDSDLEFGRVDFTTWRQRDNALRTKYSPSYMDYRYDENGIAYDYSGLSALFGGSDFEEAAHKLVRDIESSHVAEVQDLWNATNAATKKILRDGYKAGMMSKDTYLYVRDMYSHYIPLRGWDGTTADQVWDYVGGGKGAFNQTLKTAHGRTSIADDPIAYIENMAESGILLNNKNWVKQHLMLLAQNHPTSLLTLSKAWYVKSTDANGNEEWIPATPQITSQMNSNQVKAAIDAFEQKMENMAQTGDATQKRDGLNIAYPQTHSEEREHEVRVMKDGEEYVIYVNGDPQLAQAMNNTRAHRVREIQSGKLDRAAAWLGRKMAAAYTSLSPLFIPSNYFRDLTMTLASTAIREDAKYNYLLRKNLATSWNLGFMLRDYQNGKLREKVSNGNATPKEQMFYDFMMNGGETGFVSSLDVEDLKKKFKNDLKDLDRWKANPVKVGHTIMDGIEFLNRAIEDSNRFAVYMTSIQYGRSIDEAVNDAKDVTLNFNRKGTGEYGWQMVRNLYLFINPAVQSLQTLGALVKHHPFKFTAVTASWLASGVLVPIVNAALMSLFGGDDDKDKYWQFTKWDRRNNAIMWIPLTHEYVKIPLAQEFRAFYGVGDMIASKMMGGELAEESWSQYAEDLLGQVVDMLPLDPTGYDGNIAVSLMPNAIRPVFELAFNVDFTGKPLFKETEYNKYDPNFTKAYVGTPDWLVRASKMVNSIGNDYPDVQQNSIDAFGDPRYNLNNPAVVDHVLSSYLGGAYTMGSQVLGVLTKSLNDPKEIKVADIPLFSKFVSNPDDRPVSKKQGDEFWDMKENHDRAANTLSKLKKQAKVDGDYSMLERFYGSEEYKQYKQDDVKVKKYEEDKKKERAEESGEEYRPHKLNAEDIYKAHATPKDDFEDLKLKQLYTKLNGFKTSYDLLVDTAPSQSDGYYNTNKAAIDAIDEIALDKQEISELKKGFLDDGKDAYNAEDMKQIRDLRKKILAVLEKANKVVVANQKAKTEK